MKCPIIIMLPSTFRFISIVGDARQISKPPSSSHIEHCSSIAVLDHATFDHYPMLYEVPPASHLIINTWLSLPYMVWSISTIAWSYWFIDHNRACSLHHCLGPSTPSHLLMCLSPRLSIFPEPLAFPSRLQPNPSLPKPCILTFTALDMTPYHVYI